MRPILITAALLFGTAALAQQPPETPPSAPPPGESQPVTPAPVPQTQTPGMQPDPSAPPPANPTPTPTSPGPGSTPGQMAPTAPTAPTPATEPTGTMSAPRQAMTDYPVCTRQLRDGCRQPERGRVPPPR